ncbi:NUDIX hydrolase [Peribacillus butanolivorans]|uniref:hypothetical protein n=1 Tax=Peribacillus butanolivorans TaxID=421767 RepID=UPI0012F8A8DF
MPSILAEISMNSFFNHYPTGGGAESGLTFRFFWVSMLGEVELVRGHGDYLHEILDQ